VTGHGIRLQLGFDQTELIDDLASNLGGRAGIDQVLGSLNRAAIAMKVPVRAANYGFRWNDGDAKTEEWWPQGITTAADAGDTDDINGRRVVIVAWYAKRVRGRSRGVRLSVVDVTEEQQPRYRHVLLVQPVRNELTSAVVMDPIKVHAGGIVWYGPSLLVADTRGGMRIFNVDDIIRVGGAGHDGYRFVLPQRAAYQAVHDDDFNPFRFSFVSLDRSGPEHEMIAGEYASRGSGLSTRLVRFPFDPTRLALSMRDGFAHPKELVLDGIGHMQGATVVRGTYYITTSRGRFRRGSLWVRRPGEPLKEHRGVLSVGPEDLTYWPQKDRLWSLSEYPRMRYVYAMPLARFG
jgi:hypothetical protein